MRVPLQALVASLGFFALGTHSAVAEVYVEPWNVVVNGPSTLQAGQLEWYALPLTAGTRANVVVQARGGLDNTVQTWLVDGANLQLLRAGQRFSAWTTASPRIVARDRYSFVAPATAVYYLVIDNRAAVTLRNVAVYVETSDGTQNAESEMLASVYTAQYEALKGVLNFPDFNIAVRSCGTS